jgi:hypothetical protein
MSSPDPPREAIGHGKRWRSLQPKRDATLQTARLAIPGAWPGVEMTLP